MANNPTPLTTLVQFCDPDTGFLTNQGRTIIQQLIDRTGGANGGAILFAGSQTWAVPTGSLLRNTFVSNPVLPVSAAYSQAEVTALRDFLVVVASHLAALIIDNQSVGVIE